MTQLSKRQIALSNKTLTTLIKELGTECQNVITSIYQFQLSNLTPNQETNILTDLLNSAIHLQTHCNEDFQDLIADAMESLPDADETP
jgi:hypothetical protein